MTERITFTTSAGRSVLFNLQLRLHGVTISPAVDLGLQPQDGVLHSLVLLLLLFVLLLPLLRRQLQVDGGGVPNGLGSVRQYDRQRQI